MGRAHEPGHAVVHCFLRDPDGDLLTATMSGYAADSVHSAAGSFDTLTVAVRELAAGEYQYSCTAVDEGGRTAADTITIAVDENRPPTAGLSVAYDGTLLSLSQRAVIDPQGDTVRYTIEIEGPDGTIVIGPRTAPLDTAFTLPEGSYRFHSIVSDGFVADTTRRWVAPGPPTLAQAVTRTDLAIRYTSSVSATSSRLIVLRNLIDTVYVGPVPADTVFAGLNPGDQGGLLKGEYEFGLRGNRGGRTRYDLVVDTVPEFDPAVDLGGVYATVPLGGSAEITLPVPTDPNREDHPPYADAASLDGKVSVELSNGHLTLTAAADSIGEFRVELLIGGPETGTAAVVLAGVIDTLGPQAQAGPDSLRFKSGYEDVAAQGGGGTAVEADLVDDDLEKNPLIRVNFARQWLGWFYRLKRNVNTKLRLAIGVDYTFVNQFSSFSVADRQAASGIFRVYGTWRAFGSKETTSGNLVARLENRHLIGSGVTPRDLGYDGGSALSTATFKDFGWGITILHWKQTFKNQRYILWVGNMDPGNHSDVYMMLTAYKALMNEAYFNNPTVSLPQQGFGVVGRAAFLENWYVSAGLHDANGDPTEFGLDSFFGTREYYTWFEGGWTPGDHARPGEGVHVNVWRQDAREEQGTEEAWGVTFSANLVIHRRWSPFLRAGYSWGDGGQVVRFILGGGVGAVVRGTDFIGVATSLSGPPDSSLRNQVTSELIYRLQLTENIQVSPSLQLTINPSQTLDTDALWIVGLLRLRLSL